MSEWRNPLEGRVGISITEAASALGVCKNTLRSDIARGGLDVTYFGDKPIVSVASLMRRLSENKTGERKPVNPVQYCRGNRRGRPRKTPRTDSAQPAE